MVLNRTDGTVILIVYLYIIKNKWLLPNEPTRWGYVRFLNKKDEIKNVNSRR